MTTHSTDDKSDDSTATDDNSTLPIDFAAMWDGNTIGIGEVTGDVDTYADYEHAKVGMEKLTELVDVADTLGWSTVHLALCDEAPVILQNADADDKPTLALAPRVTTGGELGDD